MLVISRRVGERITIGQNIEVVVTEVTRKGVRLGISAPSDTPILRGEVRDAVEQANRAAAETELGPGFGEKSADVPAIASPAVLVGALTAVASER
ncbi:MAG TPA: carbon storage regulator [Polyangiaceae bacterium]|jgi:carbon storage regulator|nr:carbon storage regulator [Polyangiaceae bacterium]